MTSACGAARTNAREGPDFRRPRTLAAAVLAGAKKLGTTVDFGAAKAAGCDRVPERSVAVQLGGSRAAFERRNGVARDWFFFRCVVLYSSGRPRIVDEAVRPDGSGWVELF